MSDLELLKRYLQNEIDTGSHKIFVFDKDYNAIEFKIIEALNEINNLQSQLQQKENIIKEVRDKVDNFDVFKEFTFPLMKRDEEQQVKSSIDYEWRKSIKEPILEILDKENK